MCQNIITKVSKTAMQSQMELFDGQKSETLVYLLAQPEIRMAVYNSSGMGHQACTANIINALARWGYTGTVRLFADMDIASRNSPLAKKLLLLFPQMGYEKVEFNVGGLKVRLNKFVRQFPTEIEFGILGGYDRDQDFEGMLNVKNLVILQPFRWTRGDCLIIRSGQRPIDLSVVLDPSYLNRGFYMPAPVLTAADKKILVDNYYDRQLEITETVVKSSFNIGVTYGITTLMSANPEVGLFNYVSGILNAQDKGVKGCKGGAIVLSLGTLGYEFTEQQNWDCFQQWVYSGTSQKSSSAPPSAAFASWHSQTQVAMRVKVLPDQYTLTKEVLQKALAELKTREVLVVNVGSLPQLLFNYLYGCATLPTVFEGQSTTDLMLNMGNPYLKLSGTEDYKVMSSYPTLPVTSTQPGNRSNYLSQLTYNAIQITPDCWAVDNSTKGKDTNYKTYPPVAGLIIIKAMKDPGTGPALDAYFTGLKIFFNNEKNDKLLLALNYFVNVAKPLTKIVRTEISPLEELFNKLKAAVSGQVLDYYKAIDSGTLFSFFKALGSALNITVTQLEMNADKTSIELNGTTSDFGLGNTSLSFVFGYENNNYQAVFAASFPEADIPFAGAQWLTINDWGLSAVIKENNTIPVSGALTCTVAAGKKLQLEIKYPNGAGNIIIGGQFIEGALTLADIFELAGGMNLAAQLPAQLSNAAEIGLSGLEFAYNFTSSTAEYFSLDLSYSKDKPWTIIPDLIEVKEIGCNIIVYEPGNVQTRALAYSLNGKFKIADGEIAINASLPDISIYGGLSDDSPPISIDQLIQHFLDLPSPIKADISAFDFNYQNDPLNYSVSCKVETDWPIGIGDTPVFTIKSLGFSILGKAKGAITGAFTGSILILPDSEKIELLTTAAYNGANAGWVFSAQQISGQVSLIELFTFYLPKDWQPDTSRFDIKIDGLGINIETNSSSWEFTAKTATPIKIPNTDLEISGKLKLGYKGAPVNGNYGTVAADIVWNNIDLTLFYNFDPKVKAFGVSCLVGGVTLTGEIKTENNQSVARLSFAGTPTVGGLIETFISWATGAKFGLASPWSILNDIPLPNVTLKYDFTAKTVSFDVSFGEINLGFAKIKGINVSYNTNDPNPDNNGVIVKLNIESSFGDVKPWNAAKPETTPAPPGQGNKYLDLRMLAMGQHVSIADLSKAGSVKEAITIMEKMPVPAPGKVPAVAFDANSSWLTGMDFGVLKSDDEKNPEYMLTLQMVFNDPNLYGLRIALAGEAAKVFAGLDFQIMYKKISDSVGVYMAEITLPDMMRKIKMGAFNITLPVFGIELYTNGDFQVDIGFPWKQDFSRSLTFDALIITPVGIPVPVMGSVGLYFGKLSSATTNKVPQSSKGTFNPVLVFGYGMQFGLGYSFEEGPLKAGFSLTIVAILEGVLAKWNPYKSLAGPTNNTQLETAYYFWIRGTVGIIGRLYGSIDFAIIKASLTIDIRVIAQITFTPYEPILLSITASVDVSLEVSISLGIFTIHISFSFSARISQSVTLPAIGGRAPWAEDAVYALENRLQQRLPALYKPTAGITMQPVWSNLIKADTAIPLKGYLGLGLTVAGDNAATPAEQAACYVSMLFIESVLPPQADRQASLQSAFENKRLTDTDTSFEKLCKMIFRWAIAAIQPGPVSSDEVDQLVISDGQLKELLAFLSDSNNPVPIPSAAIDTFMGEQFLLKVMVAQEEGSANATFFPMPDNMQFSVPAYGNRPALAYAYGDYNSLSNDYVRELAKYFDELAISLQQQPLNQTAALKDTATTSMSSFMFADYFLLLSRQMIQAARNSLKDFKYFLQSGDTPQSIVNWVQQNGQVLYNATELFTDNASLPLTANGHTLSIISSSYLVQSTDTFNSIAKNTTYADAFTASALALANTNTRNILNAGIAIQYPAAPVYFTLAGQSLADIATALQVSVQDLINNANITGLENLLLPVATISIPSFNYTVQSGDTLRSVASRFGITPLMLANAEVNTQVADLFDSSLTPAIDIVYLGQFSVGQLLTEIQATQGLQHLSGMTSRYYMAGLRLPTSGITPQYPGMWVQQNGSKLTLPPYAGLYALTGQQFPLPAVIEKSNYDISYSIASNWLIFDSADPSKVVIPIAPGETSAQQIQALASFATNNRLDTATSFLGAAGTFNSNFSTYPFTSSIDWNCPSAVMMPYGNYPPGNAALRCWPLPDTLLSLPHTSRAVNPRVQILSGQYDTASGAMLNSPVNCYGYATQVAFSIKKVPGVANSPATLTTYEITGADGANADILEKMVVGIGNDDSKIAGLSLAFAVDPNGATSQGLQSDDPQLLTMGIAKVNLSTDTRPDMVRRMNTLAAGEVNEFRLLNTASAFINLLWEAGITRAGGFYLYYNNAQDASGFPDRIFNDQGEATLHLIVLYSAPSEAGLQNNISNYMNTLVTAQAMDTSHAVLFAQADPLPVQLPSTNTQNLQQLSYDFYANVADVATENQQLTLRNNITIQITEGVFETGPGVPDNLDAIADWFGTSTDAVKNANPLRTQWPNPLPLFTAVLLPHINVVIGSGKGGNTLKAIAAYYGQNISSLANFNQQVAGIFADGQLIAIQGGPSTRSATVPAGVVAMEAIRPLPPVIPDNPADPNYAKYFLQHTYSLLTYQLAENEFFKSSNISLPVGATAAAADPHSFDKLRAPKATADWNYKLSIPYSRFSKQNTLQLSGLPNPNDSPYRGVGDLLAVNFAWQDYYGNQIITTLSQPQPGDQLNQPPVLTGYTDQLMGVSQWPCVNVSWLVQAGQPSQLQLPFNFDNSPYQGLNNIQAQNSTTVLALFTMPLDKSTAVNIENYSLKQQVAAGSEQERSITINAITLNSDQRSVNISVDKLEMGNDLQISLSFGNVSASDSDLSFSGVAGFFYATETTPCTTPVTDNARRDLQAWQQLWYQLTDPNGIQFSVNTTLLQQPLVLAADQVNSLVQNWIASIYLFLADRANAKIAVPVPAPFALNFPLNFSALNSAQLFKLDLSFLIERTGGSVAGDFETTGGIKQVVSTVAIYAEKTGTTYSFDAFAQKFEAALLLSGQYQLRVATGVDRSDSIAAVSEVWAVRVGLNDNTAIGYQVNDATTATIFAPRPMSNVLQSYPQVPIYDFDPKTGISPNPSRRADFSGIDMDQWARLLFSSIDTVLSPAYTAAVQLVDEALDSPYYAGLTGIKSQLADIVKQWMIPVFENESADAAGIQESFRQLMLVQLSNAYNANAAVQFSATVQAAAAEGIAPRLYGAVTQVPGAGNYSDMVSLTAAKLELSPAANATLNCIITSPQIVKDAEGSVIPYLDLDLNYQANTIEHQISRLSPDNPYLASSWLHFLTAGGNSSFVSALGKCRVPLILRSFPATPAMISQAGKAAVPSMEGLDFNTLLNWDYTIRYARQFHYPQDIVSFEINFNVSDNNARYNGNDNAALFAEFAEFITVLPGIQDVFNNTLTKIDAQTTDGQLFVAAGVALKSFIQLGNKIISVASNSTNGMAMSRPGSLRMSNDAAPYHFALNEGSLDIENVEAFVISISEKVPEGIAMMEVQLDNCNTFIYKGTDDEAGYRFYFKDKTTGFIITAAEGQQKTNRTIVLSSLNILARQDAETLVQITRNEELVPDNKSAAPFIYTTGQVGFANNYYPVLNIGSVIDISTLNAASSGHNELPLQGQLSNLFAALLLKNTQLVLSFQMTCNYSYTVNPAISAITVPVLMQPLTEVQVMAGSLGDKITLEQLISNWTDAIKLWWATYQPNLNAGSFNFDLNIFSNLTEQPLPLVKLNNLQLEVQYITDL